MNNPNSKFEDEVNFFSSFHELEYWLDVTEVKDILSKQMGKILSAGFNLDGEEIIDWVINWHGSDGKYSIIRIGFTSRYRGYDVRVDSIESDNTVINKKLDLFFSSTDMRDHEEAVIKYLRNAGRVYLDKGQI